MMRNLKTMGMALLAVLAFSAVVASGAQAAAAHFTGTLNSTLSGTTETGVHEVFSTTAGSVSCHGSFSGKVTVATNEAQTVNASYTGCTPFFGATPNVNMGSCDFVFHPGTYGAAGSGTSTGTADLICTKSTEPVTITVPGCDVTVHEQKGLSKVHFQNSGTGITVKPEVTNIKYTHSGFLCGTGTGTTGTYKGAALVTGSSPIAVTST
jgi:hypothetical protein